MIGELIKDARRKVGMTQDGLALKAGIRAGNVSRLERKDLESCQVRTLERIATALGLELVIQMREPQGLMETREAFRSLKKIREEFLASTPEAVAGHHEPVERKLTGAALRNAGKPVIKATRVDTEADQQRLEQDPEKW